jgi:hypothetical protein
MNILQQYQKAVAEQKRRGAALCGVTHEEYRVGQEFEYNNGYSHKWRVGDLIELAYPSHWDYYGKAKVIRSLGEDRAGDIRWILRRVS